MTTRNSTALTTVDDDPEVKRLYAKELEAHAWIADLDEAAKEIAAGIERERAGTVDPIDTAAARVLQDGVDSFDGTLDLQEQATIVGNKMKAARRAFDINRQRLDKARHDAGMRIAESRKPRYAAIVAKMKSCILALRDAMADEAEFRRDLRQADVSIGNGVMQPMWLDVHFDGWLANAKSHYGI